MTLVDLLDLAASGYGIPETISQIYDPATGEFLNDQVGDALAVFVVRELSETFDPDADDYAQLAEAVRAISAAVRDLKGVLEALAARHVALPPSER